MLPLRIIHATLELGEQAHELTPLSPVNQYKSGVASSFVADTLVTNRAELAIRFRDFIGTSRFTKALAPSVSVMCFASLAAS